MVEINIVILDDYPIIVAGLELLLANEDEFKVVGCFNKIDETLAFINSNSVDLILLDSAIVASKGLDLCKEIKKIKPEIKILILSDCLERSVIMYSLQQGVSGYLLKNTSVELLFASIRQVLLGDTVFCNAVREIVNSPVIYENEEAPRLTKREKEILKMVSEGKTSILIAEELSLSSLTVDTHRKNILNKFKAKNVAELTKIVVQQGILY